MPYATHDFEQLVREHHALMRAYGRAQTRCAEQLRVQAQEIDLLRAQAMRLRADVVLRETALAWAREDRAALAPAPPGPARRIALARRAKALLARIRESTRACMRRERPRCATASAAAPSGREAAQAPAILLHPDDPEALELSLHAADLVICQTGCLTHGAYWRVQDHCKRTGKTCVLVERPQALRIVRIHRTDAGDRASVATLHGEPA